MIKDYTKYLSNISLKRKPSAIRALTPLSKMEGMISLAGGLPNPQTFPFESCSFKLLDGSVIDIDSKELANGLQYAPSEGVPSFHKWLLQFQQKTHNPIFKGQWNCIVSTGSQDALTKAFEMFLNENDSYIIENPTYSGAIASLDPLNCEKVVVPTDGYGILPDELNSILEKRKNANKPTPKFLYTIPNGQNPSGSTQTLERKQQVYEIASKYDFIILEDDPYYFLRFDEESLSVPSYFSMDHEGRVLRFDSFSKILSSGIRLGWCTGPSPLIEIIHLHTQASSLHASALSQVVIYNLLLKWGSEGLDNHIESVQKFYKERRDIMVGLVEKHLSDYVTFVKPSAGMFIWMKLKGIEDSKVLIETKAREKKVLLVPGEAFHPMGEPGPYVRAAFSVASKENMEIGLIRLKQILQEEQKQ